MYLTIMMTVMLISITWIFLFDKQSLGELKHPALITEWKINTDKSAYKKQAKEKHKPSEKNNR